MSELQQMASQDQQASGLASLGRNGDSMLVHMNPQEVAGLQSMAQQHGRSLTTNPYTGLPEAFQIGDLLNLKTYTQPIQEGMKSIGLGGAFDALSNAASFVGQNPQYVIPFIPGAAFSAVGLGEMAPAMRSGLLGGLAGSFSKGRFNLQRGLMSGLTSYGLGSAYEGLQEAGKIGQAAKAAQAAAELPPAETIPTEGGQLDTNLSAPAATPAPSLTSEASNAMHGIQNLISGDKSEAALKAIGSKFGSGKMAATMMGITGTMGLDEQDRYLDSLRAQGQIEAADYARQKARIAESKRRSEEAVRASPYRFAEGGEVPLYMKAMPETEAYFYKEGGEAKYIDGDGDGMSDSVPAVIGKDQPARLADGEFVIPADVVSHIGNGSTKAGARQLYEMMDRIRKARTGRESQAKEINPTRYMPA